MSTIDILSNPYNPLLSLVGSIFLVAALVMKFFPPKKINALYGYRTKQSMENQQKWDFAQKYSANQMIFGALFLIICSFFTFWKNFKEDVIVWYSTPFLLLAVVWILFKTENALKKIK